MKKHEVQVKPQGNLFVVPLEEVLPQSMLPYAEFVIMDRALPRVEDGLKPVQRRILYTMFEMGLTPDKPHKKSARIVGDCMGKYHPHGDSSVYDAMVRMAQDFSMGRTLVNGHGNFGSVDGDPAAAMRYTEARLEPLALELLRDLDKNTVPFSLNFDDSLKEPDMLPGRFPNLLVNGASGIAVGLATNIPPHNLSEVIDGVVAYIDKPSIKLPELMKYIPAPDFPTGGYLIPNELEEAYRSGKGRITLRARTRIEEGDGEKKLIVFTELPYQVNKSALLRKIADLREEKKEEFACVTRITDESDRSGMRAVIEVKGDADIPRLLKSLYKNTDLEISFGINMVAIAGGKPRQMGLLEIVTYYANYQREVVLRRCKFDLAQAKERCHILEGLIIAVRNIDEVIRIIKGADSTADAREKLKQRFDLSDRQAQAILDLRLARLTKLEVFKLEEELKGLREEIARLTEIVGSKQLQFGVVKKELREIQKKYPAPRRTAVWTDGEPELERADIRSPGVPALLVVTADGKLKTVPEQNFDRSDKNVGAQSRRSSVIVKSASVLSDGVALVFSDRGNCYRLPVQETVKKFSEGGYALSDLFDEAVKGEKPVAVFAEQQEGNALFVTKNGMLKCTAWQEYGVTKERFQAIKLADGDALLTVETDEEGEDETVFFVTRGGFCLNAKKEIPTQGRVSQGVKGINLKEGDEVLFATQIDGAGEIVLATSENRFKRVITAKIDPLARNCRGVRILDSKAGSVIFADYVTEPYMLAIVTDDGMAEIATEDVAIEETNTRGKPVKGATWKAKEVYAMKYLRYEE